MALVERLNQVVRWADCLPAPRAWAILFAVALAWRLVCGIGTGAFEERAMGEGVLVARNLAATGEFANPYRIPTGPTAHLAPLYPALLALLLTVVPVWLGDVSIHLFGVVQSAAYWATVPVAARMAGMGWGVGLLAGLMGAVYPLRWRLEVTGSWEAALAGIVLLVLLPWWLRLEEGDGSPSRYAAAGGAWALAALLSTATTAIFAVLVSRLVIAGGSKGRMDRTRKAAVAAAAFVTVVSPWVVRNTLTFDRVFFIRDNLGLELSLANHDQAGVTIDENLHRVSVPRHPNKNPAEAERMARMGETAYYQARQSEAKEWIAANPAAFAGLTLRRAAAFWLFPRDSVALLAVEGSVVVLGFAGLLMMLRDRVAFARLVAWVWLVYPCVYYLVQADMRYAYPIYWSLMLCAAYAAHAALRSLAQGRAPEGG